MGQQLANTSAQTQAGIAQAADALRWYLIQWSKEADAMNSAGAVVDQTCIDCAQYALASMQYLTSHWPGVPVDLAAVNVTVSEVLAFVRTRKVRSDSKKHARQSVC